MTANERKLRRMVWTINIVFNWRPLVLVTAEDIRRGRCSSLGRCPIGLALRRTTGTNSVRVTPGKITIGHDDYRVPRRVAQFVRQFDLDGRGKPFKFRLQGAA